MNYTDLMQEYILEMEPSVFFQMRTMLVKEYISFAVLEPRQISREIMAEKLCDYFEKLGLKSQKDFSVILKTYMVALDNLVKNRIPETGKGKKSSAPPIACRARRYYEKAQEIRKSMNTVQDLTDYTRLMMCLYAAVLKSNGEKIIHLNYAVEVLNPADIINAMATEVEPGLLDKKRMKSRFDLSDPYGLDRGIFILAIVTLYAIIGETMREEEA